MRGQWWAALFAAMALTLTACAPSGEDSDADEQGGQEPAAPSEELAAFYEQSLTWEDCEGSLRCTHVEVPMDYSDPEGETLEIAMVASLPEDETEGTEDSDGSDGSDGDVEYLLTNPGGPGESGYDLVAEMSDYVFSAPLQEHYGIIGFDPRGVHRSAPVECFTDEQMDDYREQTETVDEAEELADELEAAREAARQVGEDCLERTGESLEFVDTESAARDMDVIRAALGQETLHYMGFSYGTHLGITYAELFGDRVGRFVLDGMMDTSIDGQQLSLAQARGFDAAFEDFARWCADRESCPVEGEASDVVDAVQELFAQVAQEPVAMPSDRTLSVGVLVEGFILPMYDAQGWPLLEQALTAAVDEQDFTMFQAWADASAGRGPDGSYDWQNSMAFNAVMCLDFPASADDEQIQDDLETMAQEAPTFGPYFGHSGILCGEWPFEASGEPEEPQLDGVEEILFIGTSGDPATPVRWAEDMHQMVPESSLLVYEGEGHIAYAAGDECVEEIVHGYLLDGELFEGRTEC